MEPRPDPPTVACEPAWVRDLVLRAGELVEDAAGRRDRLRVDHKGQVDLVTETDLAVQRLLVDAIRAEFPDDAVVAEEGDLSAPATGRGAVWYVDPLDGTTNFVHGYPFYCISVARWVEGRPGIGVIWAPALDELYTAHAGRGAALERPRRGEGPRALTAGPGRPLDRALLATGFPYHRGRTATLNLAICARALARVQGLRRGGSAALDLCHVAEGRLDGYWEMGLAPWDVAAATVVAREAGVVVTDFRGGGGILDARRVVAARPPLDEELRRLIVDVHRDPDPACLGDLPTRPVPLEGPLPGERA